MSTFIISINIPAELTALRQWVLWRYIQRADEPKPAKVPHTAMGYPASPTNPEHWSEYNYLTDLLRARPGFADGVGFVFTADDPYCGIDLDNIYPSDAAECAPWGEGILKRFSDTYGEMSPSGKGIKLWCRAQSPRCGKWPVEDGAIEIYDRARYFTVTGQSAGVALISDHQHDVERLVRNLDEERGATLSQPVPDTIPRGKRHPTLVLLAGTMWRRGMATSAIEAALLVTNEQQCDPPYPPEHIHKIVQSMQRWER
jgi:primase-polymerase (primpol)-like protein